MQRNQGSLFDDQKIKVIESIQLTIDSINAYGPLHDDWAVAWSGGKDSTTLVTLLIWLIETGRVIRPKTLTIYYADTRLELTPLWYSAKILSAQMKQKGFDVMVVMAPIDKRFLVYILGRGVPPPSNTFRWCTGNIKVAPMEDALGELFNDKGKKILMLTGVRQGESAIRDGRIAMSCGKNGAECGQGWYQTGLDNSVCSTLAPILHWRICNVWDWLKIWAPSQSYGGWNTTMLADVYGGDEATEIMARTGCVGCPLVSSELGLNTLLKQEQFFYLTPLRELKNFYVEMRKPKHRLRKPGGQINKNGTLAKNQQRMGPLTLEARLYFLRKIILLQKSINNVAIRQGSPLVDILNEEEIVRINELIAAGNFPHGWEGNEPTGDIVMEQVYNDGSVQKMMFNN